MEKERYLQEFGFVKVMQINKREGVICKVEGEVFLLANHGQPWKRERKRDIYGGSWWKFGEGLWLVEEGKDLKKKEKGKEFHKRRYFLGIKSETVEKD